MTTHTQIRGIDDILALLSKVKKINSKGEYEALCPAHNDIRPSLHIRQNESKILLNCKAGCTNENIVRTLGLTMTNLSLDHSLSPSKRIIATYPYHDADGKVIFEVIRYEPKGFAQRRPGGDGNYTWDLKGITPTLYNLPKVLKAIKEGKYIIVVEGEKDVETLTALEFSATCNPMGSGKGKWKEEYSDTLAGANVAIIPDNDDAGRKHAERVASSLYGKAKSLKVVGLQGAIDVTEWIELGGLAEFLKELIGKEPEYIPKPRIDNQPNYSNEDDAISWQLDNGIRFIALDIHQERTGIHAKVEIHSNDKTLSWGICNTDKHEDRTRLANAAYVQMPETLTEAYSKEQLRSDLDKFCLGLWDNHLSYYMPEPMLGDEEEKPLCFLLKPYILEGGGTIPFAPPGRGKSFMALIWAVCVDAGISTFWQVSQAPVLFINLERSRQSLKHRLAAVNRMLGLDPKRPLLTLNARGKSLHDVLPICKRAIKTNGVKLVVLDSISRAGYGDLTENRPVNTIIDALSGLCESWLALAHTPRANEDHIFGGIHFEAGADIVIQIVSQQRDDGTLGVGFQTTKQNDIPQAPLSIYALEFTELGLAGFRKAKPFEFSEIEERQKKSMDELVNEFILEQGKGEATATQIADELGLNRANLSHMLRSSGNYIQTRKEGRKVYYGVKTLE